jgi:hypothetical protein
MISQREAQGKKNDKVGSFHHRDILNLGFTPSVEVLLT